MNKVREAALKLLWLKYAYTFIWAHKPLCNRYRTEVIKFHHIYFCRSCFFLYAGFIFAIICYAVFFDFVSVFCVYILFILSSLIIPLSLPSIYKKFPRIIRDILRFLLGISLILSGITVIHGHIMVFLAAVIIFLAVKKIYSQQRARRKLEICFSCPEYSEEKVCSGYSKQLVMIRKYEDEATDYLLASNYVPDCLNR
ncbi:MAG: hypothetical protein CSB24_06215 [Deltaproteobacteria bacterium]|nr:MAG: hypothetical protein CSB24_06215 [Deltaproteobacteria bacterium]